MINIGRRICYWKKQQNASEESEDIDCSWLRSQISKLENHVPGNLRTVFKTGKLTQ